MVRFSACSAKVPMGLKKLPVCSSIGSMLSFSHINPLGKCCYLEHIISENGYLKDEKQHQDAKGENELSDITEIRKNKYPSS